MKKTQEETFATPVAITLPRILDLLAKSEQIFVQQRTFYDNGKCIVTPSIVAPTDYIVLNSPTRLHLN